MAHNIKLEQVEHRLGQVGHRRGLAEHKLGQVGLELGENRQGLRLELVGHRPEVVMRRPELVVHNLKVLTLELADKLTELIELKVDIAAEIEPTETDIANLDDMDEATATNTQKLRPQASQP